MGAGNGTPGAGSAAAIHSSLHHQHQHNYPASHHGNNLPSGFGVS